MVDRAEHRPPDKPLHPHDLDWELTAETAAQNKAAQGKYTVRVPGGLAFSEFRGQEGWHTLSLSRSEKVIAVIVGNPAMIDAYRAGIPGSSKSFPDGAKMAKIHWTPKPHEFFKEATVPDKLVNVDFMVKDSKRFAESGGWGYAVFECDAASNTFKPGTSASTPPQGNDAKCGATCHTAAKAKDYVFTDYGKSQLKGTWRSTIEKELAGLLLAARATHAFPLQLSMPTNWQPEIEALADQLGLAKASSAQIEERFREVLQRISDGMSRRSRVDLIQDCRELAAPIKYRIKAVSKLHLKQTRSLGNRL